MEIDELSSVLTGVPADSREPSIDWDERGRLWGELAAKAEELLRSIVPDAFCTAQEWDNRLDCAVKLPNARIVGEMISVDELTSERLGQTADRLRRKFAGEPVRLVSEIRSPIYIGG